MTSLLSFCRSWGKFMKSYHYENIEVDGQMLHCPKPEQWENIYQIQSFEGIRISPQILDLIKSKVETNSKYADLKLCLAMYNNQLMFYELVQLGNEHYRVHVEAVICENCGHRAEISATPGNSDIYFGAEDPAKARKKAYDQPNLACPQCGKTYDRRYTIWQK